MYQGMGAIELPWTGTAPFVPESHAAGTWWEEPVAILTGAVNERLATELGTTPPSTSPYTHPYEIPYADAFPQAGGSFDTAPRPEPGMARIGTGGALLLALSVGAIVFATQARR